MQKDRDRDNNCTRIGCEGLVSLLNGKVALYPSKIERMKKSEKVGGCITRISYITFIL